MYGTVARMRAKPGARDQLMAISREQTEGRQIPGYVASFVFESDRDPNEYTLVAIFEDEQTYKANAEDPAQDQEYRQMRGLLEGDPEWIDGQVVFADMRRMSAAGA